MNRDDRRKQAYASAARSGYENGQRDAADELVSVLLSEGAFTPGHEDWSGPETITAVVAWLERHGVDVDDLEPQPTCATCGGPLEASEQYPEAGLVHLDDADDTHAPVADADVPQPAGDKIHGETPEPEGESAGYTCANCEESIPDDDGDAYGELCASCADKGEMQGDRYVAFKPEGESEGCTCCQIKRRSSMVSGADGECPLCGHLNGNHTGRKS